VRERGLKLVLAFILNLATNVAPRAGAWIETLIRLIYRFHLLSLPVRERGLKHNCRAYILHHRKSLPVRERGLKPAIAVSLVSRCAVAPRAGAWIET
jgi:hypothetical protein